MRIRGLAIALSVSLLAACNLYFDEGDKRSGGSHHQPPDAAYGWGLDGAPSVPPDGSWYPTPDAEEGVPPDAAPDASNCQPLDAAPPDAHTCGC
jgi:hypothetical protein